MLNIIFTKKDLFFVFALLFLGLAWLSLILALFGIFYKSIISIYILIASLFYIYLLWKNFYRIKLIKNEIFFPIFVLFLIILFSFFSSPTIFSGRDQGSLSDAAIRLSQNHKLEFSFPAQKDFFEIYGPGQALNFPGFSYTQDGNLITQFPLGYIAWLASFFSIFGLPGLIVANGVSFFIFSCSFYFLARLFLRPFFAFLAWILSATAFTSFWFFKFTLSENLALALIWLGIYFFILFWLHSKKAYFIASFLSFSLLAFTRIEGIAVLAIALILLFVKLNHKKAVFEFFEKKIIFLFSGVFILYLINIFIDWNFFLFLAKAVLRPFLDSEQKSILPGSFLSNWQVLKVFYLYGLLPFFLLGLAGIILSFRRKKITLLPFFFVLPIFIYIIWPNISNDHPWMLRRFMFAVVPASVLYSMVFIENVPFKKIFSYSFSFFLLAQNLIILCLFLSFVPNKNLLVQIEKISHNFKETDLVLIDQNATGDNWSMMSGPMNFLYKKQSVYFFNPNDIEKIDLKNFTNIYFVIPDNNLEFYLKSNLISRLSPIENYIIENKVLSSSKMKSDLQLPFGETKLASGKIYLLK